MDHPVDLVEDPEEDSETEIPEDLLKNMMLFVQNAESRVKFRSSLPEPSRFFAATASGRVRVQETLRDEWPLREFLQSK